MGNKKTDRWTRRRLLRTVPIVLIHDTLQAAFPTGKPAAAFSRFVDVAHSAGLTETMVYGESDSFTYIVESMAPGCAFFDDDNDGWIDFSFLAAVG
jgi:hypothetical protein